MTPLTATAVRRRFLLLRGLRWLPTGLLIPVFVLLLIDRGLTLGNIGFIVAAQAVVVLVLELPTGGLADAFGRRRVLLAAGVFDAAAVGIFLFADSVALLAFAFSLLGVYRALESGPLDAWYVDAAQASDADADIERGLSSAGLVVGVSIAAGSLGSSALVALAPFPSIDPLATPLLVALLLRGLELVAIALLMKESRPQTVGPRGDIFRSVPAVVVGAIRMIRSSRVLSALVLVEFLWGFGMIAFETFTPAKLGVVLDDPDTAAALLGIVSTVAWIVAAAGAGAVPLLTRRWSPASVGAALRVAQGAAVIGLAVAVGPVGVVIAYMVTMGIHGAANPVHQGMLHRVVDDPGHRATVISANNLTANGGGMLGGVALGLLADAAGLTTAMVLGAVILAAAAPLYVIAGRAQLPARADTSTTFETSARNLSM